MVSTVFARHGLRLDVELSYGKVGDCRKYPYVKVASLITAMDKIGKLNTLLGLGERCDTLAKAGPGLKNFWEQFRHVHGQHDVYALAAAGQIDLASAIPVFLHGDEGTTYKKDACFVMSMHTPLGKGTLSNKLGPMDDGALDPHTNFAGHSFETRFLLGALLRDSGTVIS